jgi:phosphate transport system permease protein
VIDLAGVNAGTEEIQDPPQRRGSRLRGRGYAAVLWIAAAIFAIVLVLIVQGIVSQSTQAWSHFGIGFLWSDQWNPVKNLFGAATFIVGTLVVVGIALLIAVPIGIAAAAYLTELCPRRIATPLGVMIDLIAAVPSIVVGLWGLFVLLPIFVRDVEPFLQKVPVIKLAFSGTAFGSSLFLAGVVVAVMIVPTVVALTRVALGGVSTSDREAGFALGATPWQVIRRVVIPGANSGILAAVTLALGRAVGETIAVTMVIGNNFNFPHPFSLLTPGSTLGSAIVLNFGESTPGSILRSSLMALGVILLVMTLIINIGGRLLVRNRLVGLP